MDIRENKSSTDVFGISVNTGDIVAFSDCTDISVAVIDAKLISGSGELIGYFVSHPYVPPGNRPREVRIKRRFLSASRELIRVPASKLSKLASKQAAGVDNFGARIQYLAERTKRKNANEPNNE